MKKFVLDTGIILHYVRQSDLSQKIESGLNLLSPKVVPVVASVSIGEIEDFVQRGEWGEKKMKRLKNLISKIVVNMNPVKSAFAQLFRFFVQTKISLKKGGGDE